MTTAQELQKRFHACMLPFIALDDKMCLFVIEALTEEAPNNRQTPGLTHFEQYGLSVDEITRRTGLPRSAISYHLKILKGAGIIGVRQKGTVNYYYLILRESNRRLMELGYRLEGFLY